MHAILPQPTSLSTTFLRPCYELQQSTGYINDDDCQEQCVHDSSHVDHDLHQGQKLKLSESITPESAHLNVCTACLWDPRICNTNQLPRETLIMCNSLVSRGEMHCQSRLAEPHTLL